MAISSLVPAGPAAPASTGTGQRTWWWLLGLLTVGVLLRAWNLANPFQVDEFVTAAAVAERAGVTAGTTVTAEDPLVPVSGLDEVRRRSVIPYGVTDPVPLYHGLVHTVLRVLPVADWSLRLPSLLAGAATILAVFVLARRLFGAEVALVATALTAVDPIQTAVSGLARPFALANLACVLSFLALVGLVQARARGCVAAWAALYGLAVAAMGYFGPLTLLVVPAQAVALAVGTGAPAGGPVEGPGRRLRALAWLAGLALAGVLLAPEFGYWLRLADFSRRHSEYLRSLQPIHILAVLWHNLNYLIGLLLIGLAGAVIRWQVQGGDPAGADPAAAPPVEGPPPADNEPGAWLARLWLLVPQLLAIVAAYLTAQSIFQTRYLSFTTLGAALMLAYLATRDASREVRLGVAATLFLSLLVLGFFPDWATGVGLRGNDRARDVVVQGAAQKLAERWKPGDALLFRPGLIEADFLAGGIPPENRPYVERALLAPLNTLYEDSARRPVVPLTYSISRGTRFQAGARRARADGLPLAPTAGYYDADLAARLKAHKRFFITGLAPGAGFVDPAYLACLAPWMADALGTDVVVIRARGDGANSPERLVEVPPGLGPDEDVPGLTTDVLDTDFRYVFHNIRPQPPGALAALGAAGWSLAPAAHVTVPLALKGRWPAASALTRTAESAGGDKTP